MELPDENVMQVQVKKDLEMFFDGASRGSFIVLGDNTDKSLGVGIVFVTPDNDIVMHSHSERGVKTMKLSMKH